jgi:hypothetical protein
VCDMQLDRRDFRQQGKSQAYQVLWLSSQYNKSSNSLATRVAMMILRVARVELTKETAQV